MMNFRGEQNADPIAAVEFLAKYCQWAVVTLGSNGCIARHGKEVCYFFAVLCYMLYPVPSIIIFPPLGIRAVSLLTARHNS